VLLVRQLDLVVLAVALPVFLVAGLPILGYVTCAGAWLVGRAMHLWAERHAVSSLASGNRRGALGGIAAATLGRVWLVALAILIVGLGDREAGLSAAVLAGAVVTAHFAGLGIARLLEPEEPRP
jgi:hypothetical protein